jgi:predicted membrane protein
MKSRHIFWGMFLISLGLLILLHNLEVVNLINYDLIKFWPLIVILWGICLIVKNEMFRGFLSGLLALIIALVIFLAISGLFNIASGNIFIGKNDDGLIISDNFEETPFSVQFDSVLATAVLNIDASAGTYILADTTSELFYARARGLKGAYHLLAAKNDDNQVLDFKMKEGKIAFKSGKIRNKVDFYLNPNPSWRLNVSAGAAKVDFDLTPFIINTVNVSVGASDVIIKLGDKADTTHINISGGVSKIRILVPENVGCELYTNTTLSSRKIYGLKKIETGLYRSDNFDDSQKKIFINCDVGLSSLSVRQFNDEW